jgi:hypothetical protein
MELRSRRCFSWHRNYIHRPEVAERIKENQQRQRESTNELMREKNKKRAEIIGCNINRGSGKQQPLVCKFLKKHHEEYKDDPEALSSEFIKKLLGRHKDDCVGDDAP